MAKLVMVMQEGRPISFYLLIVIIIFVMQLVALVILTMSLPFGFVD
jgi:hypothetical protein